jgi:glycerate 2-kinase
MAQMSIFRNRDELLSHGNVDGRRTVLDILETGLVAGDPYPNVQKAVRIEGGRLLIGSDEFPLGPMGMSVPAQNRPFPPGPLVFDLDKIGHIFLTGGGKAAQREAKALEDVLGDLITAGHVNAKKGDTVVLKHAEVTLAGHPEPDEDSVAGARRIVELMHTAQKGDIIFECESGGGTALITLPALGLTLEDVQAVNRVMYLEHGAPIEAANAVRTLLTTLRLKHSRHAGEATLVMISTAERTTDSLTMMERPRGLANEYDYAIYLLKEFQSWEGIPEAVRQHLLRKDPAHGHLRQEEWFDKPHFRIRVMGPEYMVSAAEARARALGLDTAVLATSLSNLESRMVGDAIGQIAHEVERRERPVHAPGALLMGGELVVATGPGAGEGGRNSEFATSAALRIARSQRIVIGSADSDGADGPTSYAGGIVDGQTTERAREAGLDTGEELRRHNTCAFLRRLGDAIDTGILNTNVQDLRVVYVSPRD